MKSKDNQSALQDGPQKKVINGGSFFCPYKWPKTNQWITGVISPHQNGITSSNGIIPSPKLTVSPWKRMVGILLSFWETLFSGAMLVSGRVTLLLPGDFVPIFWSLQWDFSHLVAFASLWNLWPSGFEHQKWRNRPPVENTRRNGHLPILVKVRFSVVAFSNAGFWSTLVGCFGGWFFVWW